ncbi:MAG TPA: polysaccharide ABC transporter ATP-binding protein [Longimicrobiales bacterium]|nr:polysaccharide ABC transporter ATP-binding protein [Longimicrobiales bacterium]
MSDSRIIFDHVWKKFRRGEIHDSLRDLIPAAARRLLGRGPRPDELVEGDFWAVRDVSFEVLPGHALGIIGANGSGKSTTLRLLTRILEPTRGHCEVTGRIGALIEISAGFHGDLTGRENVFLQGSIMGMHSREIARKFDEIVEFSGIADFIDTPVKRYSSGMNARLGFAIAAHLDPDVLVIDEVLAVGDFVFQQRAFDRIKTMARSGIPVVIVSHQLDRVADLCTDAVMLDHGRVAYAGTPADCIGAYVQQRATAVAAPAHDAPLEFHAARALDDTPVPSGGWLTLRVEGLVRDAIDDRVEPLLLCLRNLATGRELFYTGTRQLDVTLPAAGPFTLDVHLQMNVAPGNYLIEPSVFDLNTQKHTLHAPAVLVRVTDTGTSRGTVQLNPRIELLPAETPATTR